MRNIEVEVEIVDRAAGGRGEWNEDGPRVGNGDLGFGARQMLKSAGVAAGSGRLAAEDAALVAKWTAGVGRRADRRAADGLGKRLGPGRAAVVLEVAQTGHGDVHLIGGVIQAAGVPRAFQIAAARGERRSAGERAVVNEHGTARRDGDRSLEMVARAEVAVVVGRHVQQPERAAGSPCGFRLPRWVTRCR